MYGPAVWCFFLETLQSGGGQEDLPLAAQHLDLRVGFRRGAKQHKQYTTQAGKYLGMAGTRGELESCHSAKCNKGGGGGWCG